MPIRFLCDCGCKVAVPEHYGGHTLRCPQCKQRVTVPAAKALQGMADRASDPSLLVDLPIPQAPPVLDRRDQPTAERQLTTTRRFPSARSEVPKSELSKKGYQPDRGRLTTVRWLGAGLLLTALVGLTPVVVELSDVELAGGFDTVGCWAYVLVFSSVVQIAYALYLVQLPDWSSTWVVTIWTMLLATGYALVLGLSLLAPEEGGPVDWLDVPVDLAQRHVPGWCFIMLCLTSLWSYFGGRFSIRWREMVGRLEA